MADNISNNSSQDEISLFLHQILLRSSSMPGSINSNPLQDGNISPFHSTFTPNHPLNVVSSSSVAGGGGLSGNDTDEYDCESEVVYNILISSSTFHQVSTFLSIHVYLIFLYWGGVPSFYIFFQPKKKNFNLLTFFYVNSPVLVIRS
jgi:hypothetical protein